jgi:peptidoglycan/xylan/chitin deacetylase (PgdA/CDA1 family)
VINAVITRGSTRELTATFLPSAVGIGYRSVRWQARTDVASPACALACAVLFPARPALARLHTPKVVGCIPSGPSFVSSGPSNRHVIALTFDDGPWPDTPQFLDVLERKHVRATFFEIGEQISTWGQGGAIERRMFADGDMIGDHTWSHANVSGAGSFAAGQISQTAAAIRAATGFTPCLFRAPGGSVSGALISEARGMGFTTIQWDIDPRDWARPGTDAIFGNVVANAHSGAIVVQHDGGGDRSQTLAALPREIDALRSRGYEFVTVTELLGIGLVWR